MNFTLEYLGSPVSVQKPSSMKLSQMRCKSVLVVLGTVMFLNLFVVAIFTSLHQEGSKMVVEASSDFQPIPSVRKKRDSGTEVTSPPHENDRFTKARQVLQGQQICRTGHIQGLKPICGVNACLKKLEPAINKPVSRKNAIPTDMRRKINFMPGWLDSIHMSVVPHLTDMQWSHGIYGSLGEIGVNQGKFTSILTFNMDSEKGEKLFVSDTFNQPKTTTTALPLNQKDTFLHYMKDVDFHVDSPSDQNKIFLHTGNTFEINADTLNQWNIPQFRFLSIDGDHDPLTLLHALEKSACYLRDGGMIVVDGVDSKESEAVAAIQHYFHRNGPSSITPFMWMRNKLYLCTKTFKEKFSNYFIENRDLLVTLDLKEVTSDKLGYQFSYFASNR